MEDKIGLLLEGGAMRSLFSAGVLDFLLEEQIHIPYVLAVSAGAYAGLNYVSKQKGRAVEAVVKPLQEKKFIGLGTFFKTGNLFDMDLLFDKVPNELCPFDYDTFFRSEKQFITSAVDCLSGQAQYFKSFKDPSELMNICRAANSLPLISRIVPVKGRPMLDGGMADAIPIQKAEEEGWNKILVVLTRDKSYRKKPTGDFYIHLLHILYRKYPKFLDLIKERAERYNQALDRVEELEKQGRAMVIRPTALTIKNAETNVNVLMTYYRHGYESAKERKEEIATFLSAC